MNTPVYHLEITGIETEATTSVARQPVIENMTEGVHPIPLAGLALVIAGFTRILIKIREKQGPLADILKDKPYDQQSIDS